MNVKSLSSYETLLLLDERTGAISPFSSHGFRIASGGLQKVKKRAQDAIFLDKSGATFRIEELSPKKTGLSAHLSRSLGIPYGIEVVRQPVDISLDRLKELLSHGIDHYKVQFLDADETWHLVMLSETEVESLVAQCKSARELFSKLELPAPEDCLDLI